MARAMASPLRVKNTAYFDIAATPPPTDTWIAAWPAGWRLGAHHSTDKRPEPGAGCQAPVRRESTAPGHEPGPPVGPWPAWGGRWQGEAVMESRQEEQTVEFDVVQGRKSLAQPTCGSPGAAP